MTIQIPYRGIIEIVGDHDVGKTIAALQTSNNMKDVCFVDDDVKGDGTVRQLDEAGMKFDDYIDLAQMRMKLGNTPTADELLQQVVLPTIERITSKPRKIIVWDTWRIVYQSARMHVERNQSKYSSVVKFQGNSQIIQGLISRVARMIEVQQLNKLKSNSELVIITHHVKDNYVGGVVVGKIPESSATFSEVCNMRMWLRRNRFSKVPVILFLKRPNIPVMIKNKLQFTNIVPLKITPNESHESIWDAIAEYQKNPIQSRSPREDETPTKEELAAISGTLTPEQQDYIKSMIEFNKQFEKEVNETFGVVAEEKKDDNLKDDMPKNPIQLLNMAKEQYGYEMSDVERILDKSFKDISKTYGTMYWEALQLQHKADEVKAENSKADVKKAKKK